MEVDGCEPPALSGDVAGVEALEERPPELNDPEEEEKQQRPDDGELDERHPPIAPPAQSR